MKKFSWEYFSQKFWNYPPNIYAATVMYQETSRGQ